MAVLTEALMFIRIYIEQPRPSKIWKSMISQKCWVHILFNLPLHLNNHL